MPAAEHFTAGAARPANVVRLPVANKHRKSFTVTTKAQAKAADKLPCQFCVGPRFRLYRNMGS